MRVIALFVVNLYLSGCGLTVVIVDRSTITVGPVEADVTMTGPEKAEGALRGEEDRL